MEGEGSMIGSFIKKKKTEIILDKDNIPEHIAIIMDGNGRWAKKEIFQEQWDIGQE